MIKMFSTIAVTGLMALAMSGVSQAQERTFRKMTSGQPAALQGAMTQSQARKACRTEMRGTRESKASLNKKMITCVNLKMQGN
ncbi:hypothetical protein ASE61_05020 [Bosea sp. Root670]|jgi:hypothetical protein|uniref:Phosphate starvation-inducible protein PsiF n=1 Tax=Bosea robiniae TaxID=1036780 RepID=A0ABY0NKR8_9HYPH|nr:MULTISPECIES: hypothetical protein [Bosea]KRE08910.1 hypothetical protein ASE61_05020 [Bosea sp. Root670]TQI75888.1 hypothetical protein FHT98_3676 [Bosea sp. AK1]SDF60047.1 hypothetical protein SAMN05421844_101992 [Bosea robiniae]HWV59496.1 hypothetical protein [Sphingopyxis sp.]